MYCCVWIYVFISCSLFAITFVLDNPVLYCWTLMWVLYYTKFSNGEANIAIKDLLAWSDDVCVWTEEAEVFRVKKSNHSKKIVKQLKKEYKEDLEKSGSSKQETKSGGMDLDSAPVEFLISLISKDWCHLFSLCATWAESKQIIYLLFECSELWQCGLLIVVVPQEGGRWSRNEF